MRRTEKKTNRRPSPFPNVRNRQTFSGGQAGKSGSKDGSSRGDIDILKAYKEQMKELENELDQSESQAEQALKRAKEAEQREPDVKIVEKTIEIDRTNYEAPSYTTTSSLR